LTFDLIIEVKLKLIVNTLLFNMPKSRRNKVVSLTKTKKKGKEAKGELVEKIHEALDKYPKCFAVGLETMKTSPFKNL